MYLHRQQIACPTLEETIKLEAVDETIIIEPVYPTVLQEQIGYWRKANQIHGWFVENVQYEEDDCRDYDVTRDHLSELLKIVNDVLKHSKLVPGEVTLGRTLQNGEWIDVKEYDQVIANQKVAKTLLPTYTGSFFGTYDYDRRYLEDLRETKLILERALAEPAYMSFIYSSSW